MTQHIGVLVISTERETRFRQLVDATPDTTDVAWTLVRRGSPIYRRDRLAILVDDVRQTHVRSVLHAVIATIGRDRAILLLWEVEGDPLVLAGVMTYRCKSASGGSRGARHHHRCCSTRSSEPFAGSWPRTEQHAPVCDPTCTSLARRSRRTHSSPESDRLGGQHSRRSFPSLERGKIRGDRSEAAYRVGTSAMGCGQDSVQR